MYVMSDNRYYVNLAKLLACRFWLVAEVFVACGGRVPGWAAPALKACRFLLVQVLARRNDRTRRISAG